MYFNKGAKSSFCSPDKFTHALKTTNADNRSSNSVHPYNKNHHTTIPETFCIYTKLLWALRPYHFTDILFLVFVPFFNIFANKSKTKQNFKIPASFLRY